MKLSMEVTFKYISEEIIRGNKVAIYRANSNAEGIVFETEQDLQSYINIYEGLDEQSRTKHDEGIIVKSLNKGTDYIWVTESFEVDGEIVCICKLKELEDIDIIRG